MPNFAWARGDRRGAKILAWRDGDEEHPWPRLRHKVRGVDDDGADAIAGVGERAGERGEVLATTRSERAVDIFQHNGARPAAAALQRQHQPPERPERARAGRRIVTPAAE